ncbi:uncharacterized protein G2W53_017618 [Senna tora]|uniref:Uncharacterized protein n=1 Tax=Senna tora TaxID=362788 RepID=A0A834TYU0_9FABA|nr:uncharacterized protein G2W53_017618 [Senna tora]
MEAKRSDRMATLASVCDERLWSMANYG